MYTHDPSRKRFLPAVLLLLAPAIACSGSTEFTASHTPDASAEEDAGDNTNIVANPNLGAHEAGTSPAGVDATAGLPIVDASGPDAGVSDASGPDALVCPSMELACDGGCLTNDLLNCGGCGKACATPANGAATCSASDAGFACGVSCSANFTHCGASCVDLQTDAKNCGSCGHDCLAGACSAGKCQPWTVTQVSQYFQIPDSPGGARAKMVTDGKYIAWIDTQAGVLEVPVTGGIQTALVPATSLPTGFSFRSLAMAAGVIAWTMTDPTNGTSVWTALEGTTSPGTTSFSVTGVGVSVTDIPRGLALDATGKMAYFIDDPPTGTDTNLYQCDLVHISCVAIQPAAVSKNATTPNDILVLGNTLFWTDSANGNIFRADLSPSSARTAIATGQDAPYLLAADSTNLYWANSSVNSGSSDRFAVNRISRMSSTTTVAQVLPSVPGDLFSMAADGVNLYLAGLVGGSVVLNYAPVNGATQSLSLQSAAAFAVGTAGGAVYWLAVDPTAVAKIYGMRFP